MHEQEGLVNKKGCTKGANVMQSGRLVLDIKEAAHALSISPWTIRRYISDGKLKPIRIGRRVLLEPSELQRLVEAGRKPRVRADVQ
jgi:excisionase family DNA binding protein